MVGVILDKVLIRLLFVDLNEFVIRFECVLFHRRFQERSIIELRDLNPMQIT